ncbi:MAG: aldehyde ferredoxin oxidoreductase N-terminal domain-containing protein, partial [Candidatus Hodarchaeota archaeon]
MIDLTNRRMETVPTSEYAERFIGGIGTASKIIWDKMELEAGALEPDNHLILSTGPLTGTAVPGSGRFELMA